MGCTSSRRSKYEPSDHDKAMAAGERATTSLDKHGNNRAAIFRFNPGAQETLFPPRHPYYKVPQADRQTITAVVEKVAANKTLRKTAVENLKVFQSKPPVSKIINGKRWMCYSTPKQQATSPTISPITRTSSGRISRQSFNIFSSRPLLWPTSQTQKPSRNLRPGTTIILNVKKGTRCFIWLLKRTSSRKPGVISSAFTQ